MAIQFTTGTINEANAAAVSLTMIEKIRDDLIAQGAWDLADEFTAAGGTVRWYVFRCKAASSGLDSDFYVVVGRNLSDGVLRSFICENYNPLGKVAQFFSPGLYYQTTSLDAYGRFAGTYNLGASQLPTNGQYMPVFHEWVPGGTSTKWWLIVENERFTVAFNGPSNGFMHFGVYTSLSTSPSLMPIHSYGNNFITQAQGAFPRNPVLANAGSAYNGWLNYNYAVPLGYAGDLRYNDKMQNNNRTVAELGMSVYEPNQGDRQYAGWALGKMKGVRIASNPPAGIAFGDAYVLSGKLWVPYSPTDGKLWDTGVASS